MMKYFKLAHDMISHHLLIYLFLIAELTVVLVLLNTFIGVYNNQTALYKPYEDFIKCDGVLYEFPMDYTGYDDNGIFITPNYAEKYFLENLRGEPRIMVRKQVSFTDNGECLPESNFFYDNRTTLYLEDKEIIEKLRLPLAKGRWCSSSKDADGNYEAVVTADTNTSIGSVYHTALGNIRVVGILTDSTYKLPGDGFETPEEEAWSIFDFYGNYDKKVDVSGSYMIICGDEIPEKGEGYYTINSELMFISYGNNLSDEDIRYNNSIIDSLLELPEVIRKSNTVSIITDFKGLRLGTEKDINGLFLRLLPLSVVVILVAACGLTGSVAVVTLRSRKTFSILHLCGSSSSDCVRIIAANLFIVLGITIILSSFVIGIMTTMNIHYYIGASFGIENILLTLAIIVMLFSLSIIMPIRIIKSKTPVEIIREVQK